MLHIEIPALEVATGAEVLTAPTWRKS
jgi:hypothetical protein